MPQMMDGKLKEVRHQSQHYRTLFDQNTGFFVRKEEEEWPEPVWAEDGPELIDLSITSYCQRKCSFCYRGANDLEYTHLGLADISRVIEQASACGTLQMALGGGNPNQHPNFVEILRMVREADIVPSYTTNGVGMTEEILKATAEYCGAIAVSVYSPNDESYYRCLIEKITNYGIKLNLHAIISDDNLPLWTKWLKDPPVFMKFVNAIIFLNYKPIGRAGADLLPRDKEKIEEFFRSANDCGAVKVGFDSCSISGIVRWMNVPKELVEPCEAAKFSAFISEDMKMYPCSFMVGKGYYGDLRKESLLDIWQKNKYFKEFRESTIPARCNGCEYSAVCYGGCRLFEEINFCRK